MKKLVKQEMADSTSLVNTLRDLIRQARQQVLRSVDIIQVQTYWQIGRHIVEFEQGGQTRADYGKRLLSNLADALTQEFGKGFDDRNLRNMRAFFQCFPNWNAVRSELSWTHYRLLLRVDSPEARNWYMDETAGQNWSTRVLERQIGTLFYERLLSSKDKQRLLEDSREQVRSEIGSHAISCVIRLCWSFWVFVIRLDCWSLIWSRRS
jgi:hypothetical protein